MIVIETPESRGGSDGYEGSTAKLAYIVQCEDGEDDVAVRLWAIANAPPLFQPFAGRETIFSDLPYYRRSIDVRPHAAGCGIFNVDLNYAQAPPDKLSFQSGGGNTKIKYGLETLASLAAPFEGVGPAPAAPDFRRGINVTKDNVEGVDILVPQLVAKFTRSWLREEMQFDYFETLETLTGTTNDRPFTLEAGSVRRTWPKGEVRFDGADVQVNADLRIEIVYTFSISKGIYKNLPSTHQFVGTIKVTDKPGWAYLWVLDESKVDGSPPVRISIPQAVYIERVYFQADFNDLQLT